MCDHPNHAFQGWDGRTIVLLTFALLFVIAPNLAHAQVFDLERERVQMADFHGSWRFQPGDDPDGKLGWANPDFNDSSWKLLHADQPANAQGYPDLTGMAWYRFRVLVPAPPHPWRSTSPRSAQAIRYSPADG